MSINKSKKLSVNCTNPGDIFIKFIPEVKRDKNITFKNGNLLFSSSICSKYILFLAEKSILDKVEAKRRRKRNDDMEKHIDRKIDGKDFLTVEDIISVLYDCKNRDNKFRTIDVAKELGIISVFEDIRFRKDLGTSLYFVKDGPSAGIKYTKEARFLYTVFKYIEFLKEMTDTKVFFDDADIIAHPQYTNMKPFRFDLFLPGSKLCIEFLEGYHRNQKEADDIRLKVIEYQDIEVVSYNQVQKDIPISVYITEFLLKLKQKIEERSIYFADRPLKIDEYIYFFKKYGNINEQEVEIAKEMLKVRESGDLYTNSLSMTCDFLSIYEPQYDRVLEIITDDLLEDQYTYEGEFSVKNIFLNRDGFCDFCIYMKTARSKDIHRYYRKLEDMCINMIDQRMQYMRDQAKKKKDFEEVVFKFHKDIWTLDVQKITENVQIKFDEYKEDISSERKLMRMKNIKMQRILSSINTIFVSDESDIKKLKNIKEYLKKASKIEKKEERLCDGDKIIEDFDILIFSEEDSTKSCITLKQILSAYNHYHSSNVKEELIIQKIEIYKDQINFWKPGECFGTSQEIEVTNVRWNYPKEHEGDEEYDDDDNDDDNEVSSLTIDEFDLNSDEGIESESELIEDSDSELENKNLVQKYLLDNSKYDSDLEQLIDELPLEDLNISNV